MHVHQETEEIKSNLITRLLAILFLLLSNLTKNPKQNQYTYTDPWRNPGHYVVQLIPAQTRRSVCAGSQV